MGRATWASCGLLWLSACGPGPIRLELPVDPEQRALVVALERRGPEGPTLELYGVDPAAARDLPYVDAYDGSYEVQVTVLGYRSTLAVLGLPSGKLHLAQGAEPRRSLRGYDTVREAQVLGDRSPEWATPTEPGLAVLSARLPWADSCDACRPCLAAEDCAGGACVDGVCAPRFGEVPAADGAPRRAFVRCDGAVLLAHYARGGRIDGYDPAAPQVADLHGGAPGRSDFAPDPCKSSGHLAMTAFAPSGREVVLECGRGYAAIELSVASRLFESFQSGAWGAEAAGRPGWAMVASVGSGEGRYAHGACGRDKDSSVGGIAYCDGPGMPWSYANHLVSYMVAPDALAPHVGCGGSGCNGPDCALEVWVWLR